MVRDTTVGEVKQSRHELSISFFLFFFFSFIRLFPAAVSFLSQTRECPGTRARRKPIRVLKVRLVGNTSGTFLVGTGYFLYLTELQV